MKKSTGGRITAILRRDTMTRRKKPKAHEGYNWHHRLPKISGGSGKLSSGNMVEVDVLMHRAYHKLFGTKTPEQVAAILNKTWLPTDWELVARKKEKLDGTE